MWGGATDLSLGRREKDAEIARLKSLVKEKETEVPLEMLFHRGYDISFLDSRASYLSLPLMFPSLPVMNARKLDFLLSFESDGLAYEKMEASAGWTGSWLLVPLDFGLQEGLAGLFNTVNEHGVSNTSFRRSWPYNPATILMRSHPRKIPEAAHLQSCLEQLSVPIYHADVNAVVGETSLSFALLNVHTRAEGAKKHVAALRQLMVDIVSHPLSSQNLLGEASTFAVALMR
ncbi:hypothetical protein Tco_1264063 [Tanacetum coccineum]